MQFNRDNDATRKKLGQKRNHHVVKRDDLSQEQEISTPYTQVQILSPGKTTDAIEFCNQSKIISRSDNELQPGTKFDMDDLPNTNKKKRGDQIGSTDNSELTIMYDHGGDQTRSNGKTIVAEDCKKSQNAVLYEASNSPISSQLQTNFKADSPPHNNEASQGFDPKFQFNRNNLATMHKMNSQRKEIAIPENSTMIKTPFATASSQLNIFDGEERNTQDDKYSDANRHLKSERSSTEIIRQPRVKCEDKRKMRKKVLFVYSQKHQT